MRKRWCAGSFAVLLCLSGGAVQSAMLEGAPIRAEQSPKPEAGEPKTGRDMDWSKLFSKGPGLPVVRDLSASLARGKAKDFEMIIRTSYRLTSAYARVEGHVITFELSDFKTVSTPAALRLKYGDIASLGMPDQIAITGVTRSNTQDGRKVSERRGFAAQWKPAPPLPDRDVWEKRSLSEIIEIGRELQPELARLQAVTSYRVVVNFEGTRRDYRAAFLWIRGLSGTAIESFQAMEPVANRVGMVLLEEMPPEGWDAAPEESGGLGRITEPAAFGTCQVQSGYLSTPFFELVGRERHLSGYYHRGAEHWNISCHCSSYCQSTCYPSLDFVACEDTNGTTGGFHVPATDFKPDSGTVQDALGTIGASCAGVYACAFAQCLVPNCLFNIQAVSGGGFTSNPQGSAFWGFAPSTGGTCAGCVQAETTDKPDPEFPNDGCPVLIALGESRLELTDLAGGVAFDLNTDGVAERLSWPAAGSSWAWIALDRNRNGRIDSGIELFGNYSPQPLEGWKLNGYAALAEHDKPEYGGNGDGIIDAQDGVFASLLLWIDGNHDGKSQPAELTPLAQRVEAIGLEYKESRSRDRYGNEFRFRGTVWLADSRKSHSVDVFLLSE